MSNYRDKGTFWLMDHASNIALAESADNVDGAKAITTLLANGEVVGARVFGHMRIDLSSEEWEKLYNMCDGNFAKIKSNVIAINEICKLNDGARIVHKNLQFAKPALFAEEDIPEDPLWLFRDQRKQEEFRRHCTDSFMKRYSAAKRSQPR